MAKKNDTKNIQGEKATFAGGCFWCLAASFKGVHGVIDVASGYTGGTIKNPTYEALSTGATGHYEAVQVVYDPSIISYPTLLNIFWKSIDPTDQGGQFADTGSQYRTAIFYHNSEQRQQALQSKERLEKSGKFLKPIATQILPASVFYRSEEYHQDYEKKNPERYQAYKVGSGREQRLKEIWGEDLEKEGYGAYKSLFK